MKFSELLKTIFLTPDEPRLRAGWRLIAQGFITLIFMLFLALPLGIAMFLLPDYGELIILLSGGIPIVLGVLVARKWIDNRTFVSLGLQLDRHTARDVLAGAGIALAQTAFIFLLESSLGWVQVTGYAWQQGTMLTALGGLAIGLVTHTAVGFYEELLSRGYQLQNLEEGTNTFWAVAITSVFFGIAHLFNPNANLVSTLGITLAGVFLAYGYLRTRRLWLPIGLHLGWNFFLGPVFGFPVSGIIFTPLLMLEQSGPEIATGGAFGPEAGLVVVPALALGALLVWFYSRGRLDKEHTDEG